MDSYYKKGLEQLRACIENIADADEKRDALVRFSTLENRLRTNLDNNKTLGTSQNNSVELSEIISSLSDISLKYCPEKTFTDLCTGCGSVGAEGTPAPPPDPPPGVLGRIVRFFKNLHENNVVVFWLTFIATLATVIGAIAAVIAIISSSVNGEQPGPTLPPTSAPPSQAVPTTETPTGGEPSRQFSPSEINQLVDLLLECPSMKDRGTRDAIVGQLPFAANVRRNEIPRTDVVNIVDAGTAYPDGIEDLIEAVRFYDKGTTCMYDIDEFPNASPTPGGTFASPATPTPAPFKIVIADFVGDTNKISIADDILDYLIIQFEEMGFVDTKEITWERIADPVENRTDAETIAHDRKATLLIWGKVRQDSIEPHFIVLDLDEAWTVSNKWGNTAIPFTSTADLREPLQQRTEVLALFVKGLTILYNEDYLNATRTFNQAIEKIPGGIGCNEDVNSVGNQRQWDGINNLLLLYRARSLVLMEGETYAERREKRDEALQCLDRVLAYDPGYPWAYIHQGNIYMGEAMEYRKGEESPFLDGLNLARGEYERALQPNDDDIERLERFVFFKAHINIGTTYYEEARYLSKHGKDFDGQAEKAIEHYKEIIEQTYEVVPDLYLANAYYGLANTYRLQGKPDEAKSYDECITAAGSSDDPRAEPLQAECEKWRNKTTDDMDDG